MIGDVTFYPNYFHHSAFSVAVEPSINGQGYACSGAEATGAAYDLVDQRRANLLTVDTNGESTDFYVEMNTTVNIASATFMIIDNHNFTTADADIMARYTSAPTEITPSPMFGGTLGSELSAESLVGGNEIETPADGILLINFSALTSDIWQAYITDNGANNFDADVTIGEFLVGVSFSPATAPELPGINGYGAGGTIVEKSRGGAKYGFSDYTGRKIWQLSWSHLSESDINSFLTLWEVTGYGARPFYFDSGENTNPTLYLVRFTNTDMIPKKQGSSSWQLSISLESEV